MAEVLNGHEEKNAPPIVSVRSTMRLLLSRIVALLVFAVSPVLPARWAGRRWVGVMVVGVVAAVGGFALLWVWLGLMLSTRYSGAVSANAHMWLGLATSFQVVFPFVLLSLGGIQGERISFFLPGFRLARVALDTIVLHLGLLLPGVVVNYLLFLSHFESSGAEWIGILLVPAAIISLLGIRNIAWRYKFGGWSILLFPASPVAGLSGNVYVGNDFLVCSLLVFQCVHLGIAGRMVHLFLSVPDHAALVTRMSKTREDNERASPSLFPSRGTEMVLLRSLRESPFIIALAADLFALMRGLVMVIIPIVALFVVLFPLTWIGYFSMDDLVSRVGYFAVFSLVVVLNASAHRRDMWTTASPPQLSRRSRIVGLVAAPCAALLISPLIWGLLGSVMGNYIESAHLSLLSVFSACLWFLVGGIREVDALKAESEWSVGRLLGIALLIGFFIVQAAGSFWQSVVLPLCLFRIGYILYTLRRSDLAY